MKYLGQINYEEKICFVSGLEGSSPWLIAESWDCEKAANHVY